MQRQRESRQPLAHGVLETPGIGLELETHHDVVRMTHDHRVAGGLAPSPALGPQVESVVQTDVGQEWRHRRPLPRSPVAHAHDPVFQPPPRSEPLPDQAEHARIADPVFQEAHQPILADRVEERPDVGIQDVAHLGAGDPHAERIQRIVRPPARAETRS